MYRRIDYLFKYANELSSYVNKDRLDAVILEIEKELNIPTKHKIKKKKDEALVIMLIDYSNSMGVWEKSIAREYFNLALNEIQNKYQSVSVKYIAYNTVAFILDKFDHYSTGGTIVSSGLNKAKKIVNSNLDKNIYVFHFSDGDNLTSDNKTTLKLVKEIIEDVNYFSYIEINKYDRYSTLMSIFNKIKHNKFSKLRLKHKDDELKGIRFKEVLEKEGL